MIIYAQNFTLAYTIYANKYFTQLINLSEVQQHSTTLTAYAYPPKNLHHQLAYNFYQRFF